MVGVLTLGDWKMPIHVDFVLQELGVKHLPASTDHLSQHMAFKVTTQRIDLQSNTPALK